MKEQLKNRILGNRFSLDLRCKGIINHDEFHALSQALQELSVEWQKETCIDKDVMEDIFFDFISISGELWSVENTPLAKEKRNIVLTLDRLIRQCLSTPRSPEQAMAAYNQRLKLWGEEFIPEAD